MGCTDLENPATPHDVGRDRAMYHANHLRGHMQYDLASRLLTDDYSHPRQTNARLNQLSVDPSARTKNLPDHFRTDLPGIPVPGGGIFKRSERNPDPKTEAVPDPKELKTPARDF